MPVSLIVQLLVTFGPDAVKLIDGLITKWETKGDVSLAEWQALRASAIETARDRMLLTLQKANIDPNSPQGVALLSATS